MKDTPEKEAYILVYNNDFNEAYDNHLTAMDAFVYVSMKLMAGNPHFVGRLYATADSICSFSFDNAYYILRNGVLAETLCILGFCICG